MKIFVKPANRPAYPFVVRFALGLSRISSWGARCLLVLTYKIRDRFDPLRVAQYHGATLDHSPKLTAFEVGRLDAVITTFDDRLDITCIELVEKVSSINFVRDTVVVVNGPFAATADHYDEDKRRQFRSAISRMRRVRVVELGKYRGLATMWNLGLSLTDTHLKWVLNDDILLSGDFESEVLKTCDVAEETGLCLGNGFASFVISERCLKEVGWFDERFVGIGSEDSDYYARFEEAYGTAPIRARSHHFLNASIGVDSRNRADSTVVYSESNGELLERINQRRRAGATDLEEQVSLHGRWGYWLNRAFGSRGVSCPLSPSELEGVLHLKEDVILEVLAGQRGES